MKVAGALLVVLLTIGKSIGAIDTQNNGGQIQPISPVVSPSCGYRDKDFILITRTLANGLNFFEENVERLVFDAAIGSTIIERQIDVLLKAKPSLFSKSIAEILIKLMEKARSISGRLEEIRRADDEKPNKNLSLPWITTQGIWRSPKLSEWKQLDSETPLISFVTMATKTEIIDEDLSDACIGSLLESCSVSPQCANLFLQDIHSKFSLTHQVIFYHIADQICIGNDQFPLKASSEWTQRAERLCSTTYAEALAIQKENFPRGFRDLFAEQLVVCSIAGFQDFLQPTWMYQLMFWEKEISEDLSCFLDRDGQDENPIRQKRSDVSIPSPSGVKCSVHFTTVGMAALAMHLRYFLESCPHVET